MRTAAKDVFDTCPSPCGSAENRAAIPPWPGVKQLAGARASAKWLRSRLNQCNSALHRIAATTYKCGMTRVANPPAKPLLIFDGECGFCRRWIERWQAKTGDRIDYRP